MANFLSNTLCVLLSFASLLLPTSSLNNYPPALFVFGDTFFDPGNNNYLDVPIYYKADYLPYGETFFGFPTGRKSDGRLICDFIATYLGLPAWKPYLEPGSKNLTFGANFGSCGAGVLNTTFPGTLSLGKQLSYFKEVVGLLRDELGDEKAEELLRNAVYYISIGGNDYVSLAYSFENITISYQQRVDAVIGNFTNVIKEMYELGGRKFAIQNVGPIGCLPADKQQELEEENCYEPLTWMARLHNTVLVNVTVEMEEQLPGFKYLIFDLHSSLLNMMTNPSKYGFNVSAYGCCGYGKNRAINCGVEPYELCSDPNDYVFFDGEHPTEHAYLLLANMLWNGTTNVTWPYNMKQLSELETITKISSGDHQNLRKDE